MSWGSRFHNLQTPGTGSQVTVVMEPEPQNTCLREFFIKIIRQTNYLFQAIKHKLIAFHQHVYMCAHACVHVVNVRCVD